MPLPGCGGTGERFDALQVLGRDDLCLAKIVEPHHDAVAICHDLNQPGPEPGSLWEVWAAEPPGAGLVAREDGGGGAFPARSPSARVRRWPRTPW